jgi:catechol 2,3-dioxygenase-like lactoylglutathione lyase family enzyme
MPVTRMNHAVLYVRDVQRTVDFYRDLLDFRVKFEIPGQAAFLQAPASQNDHDLGIFQIGAGAGPSQAGRSTVGLYHIAWEVDTLDELERIAGKLATPGPWSARPTTAPPRPSTPTIPTGSSSRCAGWCPPTGSRRRSMR